MKTAIICGTALLALALLQAGEGTTPSYESVVKDMLGALEQATKILAGVQDEPSAVAARPELRKVGQRLSALRKQARAMKQPDKKEKERLEQEYRDKFDDVLKRLRLETVRVKALPGGPEVLKEIAVEAEKKAADKGKGKKAKK
jgi:hypothetical protein